MLSKLNELQNQLDKQQENEKNKNKFILHHSNKITEYEEQLESFRKDLTQKEETINNFIREIGELSESVWQKQSDINEQNTIVKELASEIKKKDDQLADLINKTEQMEKNLAQKTLLEKHQAGKVENLSQKIAELEVTLKEVKVNNTSKLIKEEEIINTNSSPGTDTTKAETSIEKESSDNDDEILSKCKFIKSESFNSYMNDKAIEYFQYSDINIISLNLTRATMDAASAFNKFLLQIINKNANKLIVNLSACEFVDSSILGVLVSSLKKARALKGDLRIIWRNQTEYSMFSLTKMDSIFQIFDNLKDALNSYSLKIKPLH